MGIDPGLNITGYAAVDFGRGEPAIFEAGTLRTRPRADMASRIVQIHLDLRELLAELAPDLVAIEQVYAHYKHPRTAILMGHARGAIMLAAAKCGVPVASYSATMIKRSLTGNGHASKQQVQRMIEVMLGLREPPEPVDVSDALAVALCHLNAAGKPDVLGRK